MSWDFYAMQDGKVCQFPEKHMMTGGTYSAEGTRDAWLNVTYNYGKHFPFKGLNGRKCRLTIIEIACSIARLEDDNEKDYWLPTQGNVRRALLNLFIIASTFPDATWEVS